MIWDNENGSKEREKNVFLHTIFYFKLISSVQKSWQFCNQKPYWQVVSLLEPPTNNYTPNMIMTLWTCIKEKQPAVIRFIFFIMGGLGFWIKGVDMFSGDYVFGLESATKLSSWFHVWSTFEQRKTSAELDLKGRGKWQREEWRQMFSTVEKREYPSMPTAGSNVRVWCTMIADNRRMMHKMVTKKKKWKR